MKSLIQIETANAQDFKNEIIDGVKQFLIGFTENQKKVENDTLLSRTETAEMLSISLVSLWAWSKNGIIPSYRIGNKVRYKKLEVLKALQQINPTKR